MIQNKRLEKIMNLLQQEKTVSVSQLSELLHVTPKTVRLDLKKLENANVLKRVHGGAVLSTHQSTSFPVLSHRQKFAEEKARIARKAFTLLKENDVILLDDGSTSLELAKLLGDFKITVLTNDVFIVNELMYKSNVTLYVIGGALKRDGESFVINSEDSIQFVKKYHVNKIFLGVSTIDMENGVMIFYYGDRSTKRAFMAAADEVVCMADHSKFGQTAFTHVAGIDEIDTIITDSGLPEEEAEKYREIGIRVLYAEL